MRAPVVVACSAVLCLGLTGCFPASGETEAVTHRSAEIEAALVDGVVSYDEYRAGFDRFESCMNEHGYALARVEERNSIIEYSISSTAVEAGVDVLCYEKHFQPLDSEWQINHEDESEGAQFLRDCLIASGIEPGSTMDELDRQVKDAEIDLAACLEQRG